ncbi:hypothetical protein EDB89DRAFT_1904242 [Lactarius sanguifluus]|nr:hypothetical protein EDB89DRAFT_1904242 [Lactarius sanguifluus]
MSGWRRGWAGPCVLCWVSGVMNRQAAGLCAPRQGGTGVRLGLACCVGWQACARHVGVVRGSGWALRGGWRACAHRVGVAWGSGWALHAVLGRRGDESPAASPPPPSVLSSLLPRLCLAVAVVELESAMQSDLRCQWWGGGGTGWQFDQLRSAKSLMISLLFIVLAKSQFPKAGPNHDNGGNGDHNTTTRRHRLPQCPGDSRQQGGNNSGGANSNGNDNSKTDDGNDDNDDGDGYDYNYVTQR